MDIGIKIDEQKMCMVCVRNDMCIGVVNTKMSAVKGQRKMKIHCTDAT